MSFKGALFSHATSVKLYEQEVTGTDPFGRETHTAVVTTVPNVLWILSIGEAVTEELSPSGKRQAGTICIPKGDTHVWTDRKVEIDGELFHTYGEVERGMDDLLPLSWNGKIKVERYD